MSLTDVRRVQTAVRVPCPIPGFTDEEHWIKPATREMSNRISKKSQVKEYRRGQVVQELDTDLFNEQYLDAIWADWSGVGIIHDDGRVENPAACTYANKIILANSRPLDFLLWLQRTAEEVATQVQEQKDAERDTFPAISETPAGLQES